MDFKGQIVVFDTTKSDRQYTVSLTRSYPEFQFTPIQEGLREACQWLRKGGHY